MAKRVHHVEIHPDGKGGHRVVTEFHREPAKKSRDIYMEHPKPDEKFFGDSEKADVMKHAAGILGLPSGGSKAAMKEEG